LFLFFHDYESQFGELSQVTKLELILFPEDPQLYRFSQRFAGPTFDPTSVRPVISPRTQMKPVMPSIMNSVEEHHQVMPPQMEQRLASPPLLNSPHPGNMLPAVNINSPKRPLDDGDDNGQPRKLARGELSSGGEARRCSICGGMT
jgi:cleavage stimulation factor subunit 3